MKTLDPMRKVKKATSDLVAKFRHGRVHGCQTQWTLTLECGHEARRYGNEKAPKSARCRTCGAAARAALPESRPGPARLAARFRF